MSSQDPVATLDQPTTTGWRTLGQSPAAGARSRASLTRLGNTWWILGQSPSQNFSDLYSTDCLTWTELYDRSPRRALNAGVALGDRLWLTGGLCDTPPPPRAVNEVYAYSGVSGQYWASDPTRVDWAGRREHAVAAFNGKLWVIGGATLSYQFYADVWTWTPGDAQWERNSDGVIGPRGNVATAVYNNELYVIGGWNSQGALGDVAITPPTGPWRGVSPGFEARRFALAAVAGNKLHVFGGSGMNGPLSDMWTFDGGTWARLDDSCPWGGGGGYMCTVNGDDIIVLGGGDPNVYAYTPPA